MIQSIIRKHLNSKSIIENVLEDLKLYYEKPVHTIQALHSRENKKLKGDIFEHFCKLYFETILTNTNVQFYKDVWLLKDVPDDIKQILHLKNNDMGIDIVLRDIRDKYYAVQVKYRNHPKYKSKNVIGWKQLSTFYALVNRTGPWEKHIVFTNADYIRHVGKRDPKDKSYCLGTLKNIKYEHWYRMVYKDDKGHTLSEIKNDKLNDKTKLREIRLQYYKNK